VLAVAAGEYATNKSFGRLLENAMSGEAQTRRHTRTRADTATQKNHNKAARQPLASNKQARDDHN
jgi:hypothetical protein